MKKKEQLKILKEIYEYLEKLANDSGKQLDSMLIRIADMYEKIYDEIEKIELNCGCDCPKCHKELLVSDLITYTYLCDDCEENFYYHEVEVKEEKAEEEKTEETDAKTI